MASSSVWVKIEREDDEKAEELRISAGMTVSAFKDTLYESKKFAFVPGTIDCLLVRGEDGIAKVALFLAFAYVAGSQQP
jgi:hypothetical protein